MTDKTLFIKKKVDEIIRVQVYVDESYSVQQIKTCVMFSYKP